MIKCSTDRRVVRNPHQAVGPDLISRIGKLKLQVKT